MPQTAIEHALATLKRFRSLCERMGVRQTLAIATAACRDAKNGRGFIALAERTLKAKIDIVSGSREAGPDGARRHLGRASR